MGTTLTVCAVLQSVVPLTVALALFAALPKLPQPWYVYKRGQGRSGRLSLWYHKTTLLRYGQWTL